MTFSGKTVDQSALFKSAWQRVRSRRAYDKRPLRVLLSECLRFEYATIRINAEHQAALAAAAAAKAAADAAPVLHRIEGAIRGGGSGGSAWVAEIVGTHPTFKLERAFVEVKGNVSRSGRSGNLYWDIKQAGVYELRGVQYESDRATIGRLDSGFIRVAADGTTTRITKEAAIQAAEAIEAAKLAVAA